jgi:hypothetical protein
MNSTSDNLPLLLKPQTKLCFLASLDKGEKRSKEREREVLLTIKK